MSPETAATRVLVVEDDPHLAAGVMENLRAEGYEVSAAADGEQALAWLAGASCALIVLDVMLPGHRRLCACAARCARRATTPRCCSSPRAATRPTGCAAWKPAAMTTSPSPSTCRSSCCACAPSCGAGTGIAVPPPPRPRRCSASAATRWISAPSARRTWNGESQELTEKEAMILKVLAEHGWRDRLARGPAGEGLGLRCVPLDAHGRQFHPAAAQALRARSGQAAALPDRVGRGLPLPEGGRVVSAQAAAHRHARLGARAVAGAARRRGCSARSPAPRRWSWCTSDRRATCRPRCRCGRRAGGRSSPRRSTGRCSRAAWTSPCTA